ncbi:MAG: GSCFA domain-containing protein [Sandaracinaceae bacterium]
MSETKKSHPYSALEDRALWRKAVGTVNPLMVTDLYRRKFEIRPEDRIVTAGSCFAQHLARKLRESGFNFCDYEPAPDLFPASEAKAYNYGVYSARYCNIYTIRQLWQTFERAFAHREPAEGVWEAEDGCYDPFRPVVEPGPFASREDLEASRRSHLAACRRVFTECDLFVFTLGLTEAWESKLDGSVYPLCPGTVAGEFDPSRHGFRNFTFGECYADMTSFIDALREVNPTVKILLTVSPVPLTATKAPEHIMVATSYSKSVLRAVAGQLASENAFIDYFPSFEIIAATPMRAMFYERNMRSVSPAGVDFVMSHFFEKHRPRADAPAPRQTPADAPSKPRPVDPDEADVVCEEMLLDQGL